MRFPAQRSLITDMRSHNSFLFRTSNQTSLRLPVRMLAIITLTLVVTAWASDPWTSKDYKTWTAEDVQKILYESPWVKMVEVGAPWLKGPVHYLTPLPSDCNGRPDMTKNDKTPTSWAVNGATESIVIFQVTWQSSHTIRAARLREAILCGRVNAERGEEALAQEPEQITIVVHAPDMAPFDSMDEEALTKSTSLLIKSTKKKISPESVQIQRYGSGKTVHQITFKFPKRTDSGEPFIPVDEKEIEFSSQAGKFILKTKFQPPKMQGANGTDL